MDGRELLDAAADAIEASVIRDALDHEFRRAWQDYRLWQRRLAEPVPPSSRALGSEHVRAYQGYQIVAATARLQVLREVRRTARRILRERAGRG